MFKEFLMVYMFENIALPRIEPGTTWCKLIGHKSYFFDSTFVIGLVTPSL